MAKQLQLRRGTTAQHASFTGLEGEVTVDTTKDTAVVHDGTTAGGVPLANASDLALKSPLAGSSSITTLGTVTAGTLSSGVTFPSGTGAAHGHVLQVVVGTGAEETIVTSSSYAQIRAFLEPSITVTGSNKVLISFSVPTYITSSQYIRYTLYRGSTNLNSSTWPFAVNYGGSATQITTVGAVYLDTPGSGTHQYKLWHNVTGGTGYSMINTTTATIVLMEVVA